MRYVELHCKSNFSFLEGASHPDELVVRAAELGYAGLAVTDRASVAGVVRGFGPARDRGFPFLVGAELDLADAPSLVAWPTDRAAYGRLCRLISRGRLRGGKGSCVLGWDDLAEWSSGLLVGVLDRCGHDRPGGERASAVEDQALGLDAGAEGSHRRQATPATLGRVRDLFGDRAYLLCELHLGVDDAAQRDRLRWLSRESGIPLVAAGDVHYHDPGRMPLHDCVTAIRHRTTVQAIGHRRFANAQRHLRPLDEITATYRGVADAIGRTTEVADRCQFRLDELRYEYPEELAPPGLTAIEYLQRLTWEGARRRWPAGVPQRVVETIRRELELIEELRYEAYFLTVWDMVRFARQRDILCQGRGSAANSAVCFCLGITSVDPTQADLLFERFVSRERDEAPDIDVDFEHQRREEVLQYLYRKYGRDRAGMTAAVITYRTRSAVREVGKALGISADVIDAIAKRVGQGRPDGRLAERVRQGGLDPDSDLGRRFSHLVGELQGFPRHLSQHVGGMVMTRGDLRELCPIENAAMDGRTVIQWDKDDLDELGILKVDVLALGMLSAIRRCFELVSRHHGQDYTLATLPPDDRPTYDMICRADTLGVFQIESRAQMSMLPRLRPRCFYDLVVEVAIVRPGPIQGNMVHPYLRARRDPDAVVYPNDAIRGVLEKTLGVPIFQEQAMRLAVVAAGFTPGEADQLRRAMAAWRRPGVIDRFRVKLLEGMRANGLTGEFAEHVFRQIRGFGEYGFPESHAASFALLVYASCFLKCHYPAAFCAAMLNSQPLGFYAPAQLVADARRHGVEVRPADVNHSDWDSTLEPSGHDRPTSGHDRPTSGHDRPALRLDRPALPPDRPALRLGLRTVRGLSSEAAGRIVDQRRRRGAFRSPAELAAACDLGSGVLETLADADCLASLAGDRRAAVWRSLGQEKAPQDRPLFSGEEDDEPLPEALRPMTPMDEVHADYETTGLSLRAHPVAFVRAELTRRRCATAAELSGMRDGRHVRVAGIVLLRQRPGTAKGITFVTLEDETGAVNLVLFPAVWERHFAIARVSNAWLVDGKLENREGVIHVVVGRLADLSSELPGLRPRSRDFH